MLEVGREFGSQSERQLKEAIEGSVASDTPRARLLINKLAGDEDDYGKVFDSGYMTRSEPVGKLSAAHRARVRRRT